ncbi:MAG TPA: DUF4956 domain-containing protein [Polyangiaceae bacterium]|nr:DUF4956 domain-containing protein [Polyangiaceae bacterium]
MGTRVGWDIAAASLLLSFATSMVIATIYTITYHGIGYLRTFVQTISMSGLVAALVMLAIGDDVARGLGMVGALTLIRFRTTLKDTRDLVFVFASLGVGVACGVQAFSVAILGTLAFSLAALYLSWSEFGARLQFDVVLRFQGPSDGEQGERVRAVLSRYCRKLSLIDLRSAGENVHEFAYHLKLNKVETEAALLRELESVPGVGGAVLYTRDASLEL